MTLSRLDNDLKKFSMKYNTFYWQQYGPKFSVSLTNISLGRKAIPIFADIKPSQDWILNMHDLMIHWLLFTTILLFALFSQPKIVTWSWGFILGGDWYLHISIYNLIWIVRYYSLIHCIYIRVLRSHKPADLVDDYLNSYE